MNSFNSKFALGQAVFVVGTNLRIEIKIVEQIHKDIDSTTYSLVSLSDYEEMAQYRQKLGEHKTAFNSVEEGAFNNKSSIRFLLEVQLSKPLYRPTIYKEDEISGSEGELNRKFKQNLQQLLFEVDEAADLLPSTKEELGKLWSAGK